MKKIKWEALENEFISNIQEKNEVYAKAVLENDASLITLEDGSFKLNRYFNDNGNVSTDTNNFTFESIKECLQYLRLVKEDHANNYDYKDLVKVLIKQLYMNKHITPQDVI